MTNFPWALMKMEWKSEVGITPIRVDVGPAGEGDHCQVRDRVTSQVERADPAGRRR